MKVKEDVAAETKVEAEKKEEGTSEVTVFDEEEIIRDFVKGDVIEIPVKNRVHVISIDGIDEN